MTPLQIRILAFIASATDDVMFSDIPPAVNKPAWMVRDALKDIWRGDDRLLRAKRIGDAKGTIIFVLTKAGHDALVEAEMLERQCERETQGGV